MEPLAYTLFNSPVGTLRLVASGKGLVAILWPDDDPKRVPLGEMHQQDTHPLLSLTAQQLNEYFSGRRETFDLPLDPRGTSFQQSVWSALQTIPHGQTRTYAQIATQVGTISARAVGVANARNPISIIVPCHRVIGSNNSLTGYAGGLPAKQHLLHHEDPNSSP